jgi:hypothetical protein
MKKLRVLVVVLVLVGTSLSAQGTETTGQWLHDLWESDQRAVHSQHPDTKDLIMSMEFAGFVTGTAETMALANWIDPKDSTRGQWLAVVGRYLDDHPEKWNYGAVVLVYGALGTVWPGKTLPPQE